MSGLECVEVGVLRLLSSVAIGVRFSELGNNPVILPYYGVVLKKRAFKCLPLNLFNDLIYVSNSNTVGVMSIYNILNILFCQTISVVLFTQITLKYGVLLHLV